MAGLIPFNRGGLGFRDRDFESFHNVLDDFFNDSFMPVRRNLQQDTFKIDVKENEKEYAIEADMPGIAKDEINLELNEGRLTISVAREKNSDEENADYIHRERYYSSMQRSIYLGDAAPDEGIAAKLENGILKISVPKKEKKVSSHKIEIQ